MSEINPEFTEGAEVTLTKDNVEQFVRYRDTGREQSALVRQDRQKVFIEAYIKKSPGTICERFLFCHKAL